MARKVYSSWPVVALLGIGALCTGAQSASRYFFQTRLTAVANACGPADYRCGVSIPGRSTGYFVEDVGSQGLDPGQIVRVYQVGDDQVRLDSAGPPWTVWLFGVLALLYLGLVAYRVTRATAARRAAIAEGRRTYLAGEAGVLSWTLGLPLIVVGALLTLAGYSRAEGLWSLAAGFVVLIGGFGVFLMINRKRPPEAVGQAGRGGPEGPPRP